MNAMFKKQRVSVQRKIGDYLIVAALLLSAVFLFWGFAEKSTPKSLELSVDGVRIAAYALPLQGEYLLDELPYPCTLVIDGYAVSLRDTTCPGHDCECSGIADEGGESIVCLPNRLMLRLTGAGKVDTVVQ